MENSAGSQSFNDYDKSIPKSDIISFKFIEELEDTKKIDASNTNIVDVKYLNRNDIEEINIQNTPLSDLPFNRLMLLICVGSNLRVINDIPVCSEELELVSTLQEKIRNLLLEGYILTSIDPLELIKGSERISFEDGVMKISSSPRKGNSSPHSGHSMERQRRQIAKMFERSDYNDQSTIKHMGKRTYSDPCVELDPSMLKIFSPKPQINELELNDENDIDINFGATNNKKSHHKSEKARDIPEINQDNLDIEDITNINDAQQFDSNDSYDYSYGDDDSISHTPRRHSSNRHKSSKRTPKQSQVNKYEVSPNKNNFYIDEFDDVKKLHRKHSAPSVTGGQLKPSSSTPSKVQLLNEFAFLNNDNLQQTDLFMEPFPKADNPELETAFSPRQKRQRKHHKQHSEASDNSNDGE